MKPEQLQPRVLVIDDEVQMRRLLQRTLEQHAYKVIQAQDGVEGIARALTERPELIILDLGLPDMDGVEVLKTVRAWSQIPILILTVRDAEETIIEALDSGADDYLTKPFRTGELLARIRSMLRHQLPVATSPILAAGNVTIDLPRRLITKDNEMVKLTPTEFSLVALLAKNPGKVLTHGFILQHVWGPSYAEETQYLRVFVGQLRKKLEDNPSKPKLILTESRIGYRMVF